MPLHPRRGEAGKKRRQEPAPRGTGPEEGPGLRVATMRCRWCSGLGAVRARLWPVPAGRTPQPGVGAPRPRSRGEARRSGGSRTDLEPPLSPQTEGSPRLPASPGVSRHLPASHGVSPGRAHCPQLLPVRLLEHRGGILAQAAAPPAQVRVHSVFKAFETSSSGVTSPAKAISSPGSGRRSSC